MNWLVLSSSKNSLYNLIFYRQLEIDLKNRGQVCNLLPSSELHNKIHHFKCIPDIIIIDSIDSQLLMESNEALSKIPLIFVVFENTWEKQPILTDSLLLVICIGFKKLNNVAIPFDIIRYISPPKLIEFNNYAHNSLNKSVLDALYIEQIDDINLDILKSLIYYTNSDLSINLHVYSNSIVSQIARTISNENIFVKQIDEFSVEQINCYDFIFTGGLDASIFMLSGVPTIIVGSHGFGGLVSDENIHEHMHNSFHGRLGGDKGEAVPRLLIEDAIEELKTSYSAVATQSIQASIVFNEQYEGCNTKDVINMILSFYHGTKSQSDDLMCRGHSIALSRDISFVPSIEQGHFDIIRGDSFYIGTIEHMHMTILRKFVEASRLDYISEVYTKSSDFIEFMRVMMRNRVLVIRNEAFDAEDM